MFKKTLAAVAVVAAFTAGSAFAADVTLYGRIDTGLRYTNTDIDTSADAVDKFEMATGNFTGNRFGLKGEEEIGNGMKVAFVLENGYNSDDGQFKTSGTLFDRQASLHLKGGFGELAFGRMGILNGTAGTFGIGNFSAMTTGWGSVGDQGMIWGAGFSSRYDNMITYATPTFAGAKVYAQYSMGKNTGKSTDEVNGWVENESSNERYYGIGATYDNGPLDLIAIVDVVNKPSWNTVGDVSRGDVDDTVRVTVGGSYDFGVVKPYLSAAYFKDGSVDSMAGMTYAAKGSVFDGWGVMAGASAPVAGGTAVFTVGYLDAEDQAKAAQKDMTRWVVGAGYSYKLSKRTTVYADAGYGRDDIDNVTTGQNPSYFQAAVGLAHSF
ncbi:porin [Sutterella sp.]|uniref:porin n=1 Tax=Sutterella sp. TaxID=1981025 RepID=UPI0025CD032F|nr:porin [uncultured Sutterella sp.]